ncbi:MAG: hypothetical protein ACP5QT_02895 [Brevinematia bacterium]
MINVFSRKSKRFFSLIYFLISISLAANFFSLYGLYFKRTDIHFFLVVFYNALFCLAFIAMFLFHRIFFKQLNKSLKAMKIFKGNEQFLLSFLKIVKELNESTVKSEFKEVKNIISDISEILGKLSLKEEKTSEEEVIYNTILKIEELDENINLYFFQSISLIELLIKKITEIANNILIENKHIMNNILCPTYLSLEISNEWKKRIENVFDKSLSDTFKKITFIKEINESNSRLIKDTVDSFIEEQKNSSLFLLKQKEGLGEFFSHMEKFEQSIFSYIEEFYKEFEKIGNAIKNIESISETMKVVSLNMNIEASKTHGNKAFNILAKELHSLSEKTEKFAIEIEKGIKSSLSRIKEEKEKQLEELKKLHNLINISKSLTSEYDQNIQNLNSSLSKLIEKINENNERNKTLIFELFKSFQEVSITKEELNHKDFFITKKIEEISETLLSILKEKKLCLEEERNYNDKKRVLEELLTIISTSREKEFLKELYMKYLNEELKEKEIQDEKISKTEEGVILF